MCNNTLKPTLSPLAMLLRARLTAVVFKLSPESSSLPARVITKFFIGPRHSRGNLSVTLLFAGSMLNREQRHALFRLRHCALFMLCLTIDARYE